MPYISPDSRKLAKRAPQTPGDLNFAITSLITTYMVTKRPLNYQVINDVMGALEGAKAEFYRRVAVPYENVKLADNGDVYTEGSHLRTEND